MDQSFLAKLKAKWDEDKFVCVGLDTDFSKLPESVINRVSGNDGQKLEAAIYEFNKSIIDSTHDLVCAYKINSAFYEAKPQAYEAMLNTFLYIQRTYPEIPVILDAKRGDIGNTNQGYIDSAFQNLKADAITIHPYLGKAAAQPFLDQKDKGIIVLVKTSNEGSGEFQNLKVTTSEGLEFESLYEYVANNVAKDWNQNGNCAVVVGATYPEELKTVREIIGDMPILIPGIGAQGGDLESSVKNGLNSQKQGIIITSSRSIIYASAGEDFAQAARSETEKLHNQISSFLK